MIYNDKTKSDELKKELIDNLSSVANDTLNVPNNEMLEEIRRKIALHRKEILESSERKI